MQARYNQAPSWCWRDQHEGFQMPSQPWRCRADLDLTLSASIPAKLARITIVLTAESSSGDKALCVQIKTAPENLIVDQDHPENLIPAIADSEEAGGACTNAGDQQVWTSKGEANFKSDMSACGRSSMGNAGRATSCMKDKEGYSDACSTCFGNTIHCTASKCLSKCIGGETAACKQCVEDNCTPDLKACSGLSPPSMLFPTVVV